MGKNNGISKKDLKNLAAFYIVLVGISLTSGPLKEWVISNIPGTSPFTIGSILILVSYFMFDVRLKR